MPLGYRSLPVSIVLACAYHHRLGNLITEALLERRVPDDDCPYQVVEEAVNNA